MHELTFEPGPRLIHRRFRTNDDAGWTEQDVTARAAEFLFEPVALDAGLTLADVFGLLEAAPLLKTIFRRDQAESLCAEAALGPLPRKDSDPRNAVEYLELYQIWTLDTSNDTYEPMHRLAFHGIGAVQPEDYPSHGVKAGERIRWGIWGGMLREMLALPLRLDPEVLVCEGDVDSTRFGNEVQRARNPDVTLGQVLDGVLWELSFHGTPQDCRAFHEALIEQAKACDEAVIVPDDEALEHTFSAGSLEDDLANMDSPGVLHMFESLGDVSRRKLMAVLRSLPDDAVVSESLPEALRAAGHEAGGLMIRAELRDLRARKFRRVLREASARTQEERE